MTDSRKRRGQRTQNVVADWFRDRGWPHAESAGAGRAGVDVLGLPGLAAEVKARRELALKKWLEQAAAHQDMGGHGPLPFVVHRPDGLGEVNMHHWPVTMRLEDFTRLLHEAGYGDEVTS